MATHVVEVAPNSVAEQANQPCRLSTAAGDFLASGTALVAQDGDGQWRATVQGLQPAGAVTLSIFDRGLRRFSLEVEGTTFAVELLGSRWADGCRRVCDFRSS